MGASADWWIINLQQYGYYRVNYDGEYWRKLAETLPNTRFGIVIYRGGHAARDIRSGISVLPLTFDRGRVEAFLLETKPRGVDDRGSAVPHALRVALDQMCWRRSDGCDVRLEVDGPVRNAAGAGRTISMHLRADERRTFVTFTARGRRRVPKELEALAAKGGADRLEVIR